MNIAIIIPAYNEEKRIAKTVQAYTAFFSSIKNIKYKLIVVLNGCTDRTKVIVENLCQCRGCGKAPCNLACLYATIEILELQESGKGVAIKAGFLHALKQNTFDYIGFVDADMATQPRYFYELVEHIELIKNNKEPVDGVIASRYAEGARTFPPRPFIKRWGSRLVYEPLIRLLFGIKYADYQCGAKLFKTKVLTIVAPLLMVKQWAFDVELLYLCKQHGFNVIELPTVWYDQTGSKLKMRAGFVMLWHLIKLRMRQLFMKRKNNE